jgi:hypothetical protein
VIRLYGFIVAHTEFAQAVVNRADGEYRLARFCSACSSAVRPAIACRPLTLMTATSALASAARSAGVRPFTGMMRIERFSAFSSSCKPRTASTVGRDSTSPSISASVRGDCAECT